MVNTSKFVECVSTDPNAGKEEKQFTVSFTKGDDFEASFSTNIKSLMKKALQHSEIVVEDIQVYYPKEKEYNTEDMENYSGEGEIISMKGHCPVGLLKLGKTPRSSRSYGQIISSQAEVNFDNE